VVQGL